MIEIKETSREFTEVEQYLMTISPAIESVKTIEDGTSIPVNGYMIFDDVDDENGEISTIISIITDDMKVYCAQSKTFTRSFKDIYKIMNGKPFSIIKISGKSKADRDYVNCILDVAKLQK